MKIQNKLLKFNTVTSLKDIYTKSNVVRELKRKHNKKNKTKYTIQKFLFYMKKYVNVELYREDGIKIAQPKNSSSYDSIYVLISKKEICLGGHIL